MRPIPALVLFAIAPALAAAAPALSAADQAAAFRAAGFKRVGQQWRGCGDPGGPAYGPGAIERVKDFNGDGRPEAIITESSSFCFGNTGMGYTLVSKQADGRWKVMSAGPGIITVLATRGAGNWPDLEIGGPGFCFPVHRWNGRQYALQRFQYEGRRCNPGR